jgi:hypothetical protein
MQEKHGVMGRKKQTRTESEREIKANHTGRHRRKRGKKTGE